MLGSALSTFLRAADLVDAITISISLCYYFHSRKLGGGGGGGGTSTSSVGRLPSSWVSRAGPASASSSSNSGGSALLTDLGPGPLTLALPVLGPGSAAPLCWLTDGIPEMQEGPVRQQDGEVSRKNQGRNRSPERAQRWKDGLIGGFSLGEDL